MRAEGGLLLLSVVEVAVVAGDHLFGRVDGEAGVPLLLGGGRRWGADNCGSSTGTLWKSPIGRWQTCPRWSQNTTPWWSRGRPSQGATATAGQPTSYAPWTTNASQRLSSTTPRWRPPFRRRDPQLPTTFAHHQGGVEKNTLYINMG